MCVCVCVCVCVSFSPVKLELGMIPSGQLNYSTLNLPGKELNVTDITEQQFLQEKQNPVTLGFGFFV